MAERSIFSRGGNGMTTGGLDSYLGPQAQDHSSLPDQPDSTLPDDSSEMNCKGKNAEQAVCQIAQANVEIKKNQNTEKATA